MAFSEYGWKTVSHLGTPDGSAGSNRALHSYVTNDDAAAIETANYFNTAAGRCKTGDILLAGYDLDGTEGCRMYMLTVASGVVSLTLAVATAAS